MVADDVDVRRALVVGEDEGRMPLVRFEPDVVAREVAQLLQVVIDNLLEDILLHRSRPPYANSDPLLDRFLCDGFPRRAVPERAQRLNRRAPRTLDHRQVTLVQVDILIETGDPLEIP